MNFRHDIQSLRGFAVLTILLYHAELGLFKAGYLGVDVFFVISGFLITSLIIKHIVANDFSFAEFYYRRARRLHLSKAQEQQRHVLDFLNRLPQQNENFQLIRLHDHLCKDDICTSSLDNVILYKDDGHITNEGSPVLVKHVDLIGKIESFMR